MDYTQNTKIAVIGASDNPEKYGHKIFRDLLAANFTVTGVNPKGTEILGQKIYPTIAGIPEKPELLLIVVPPKIGLTILEQAVAVGVSDVWFQPGAESEKIITFAKKNNLKITYGTCFMVAHGIW